VATAAVCLNARSFTHDCLNKRVPRGCDPEHPRAEHLKRQGLTVGFPPLKKELLISRKFVPWLSTQVKLAAPLVEWLVFATV
jgi:hypothetical protein